MDRTEIADIAHLLRRAGFGATRQELEEYAARGYGATVEELLHPDEASAFEDDDLLRRYHVDQNDCRLIAPAQTYWLYRMINTKRPLEEKIALFWHQVFASSYTKANQVKTMLTQIELFRRHGLGDLRTLLIRLSRDPAMIFWLDNRENHGTAVNENYGRELLELFSMGVGNYTEGDVRQASRAFTGWTLQNVEYQSLRTDMGVFEPYGRLEPQFDYLESDHDQDEKGFLGERGRFGGEAIVDITCRQPATASFVARHLYNFFVADEVQVPAWTTVPPRDPAAITALAEAFVRHDCEVRPVLRLLFNSAFFKEAAFAKVKSPVELVVGAARMSGGYRFPRADDPSLGPETGAMGQALLDPPSVEGWHTGKEWINTASLVTRVNFAGCQFADTERPGVRAIVERAMTAAPELSPGQLVDTCLDLMGPLSMSDDTRRLLVEHASEIESNEGFTLEKVSEVLQLIASTREYQWA